MLSCHHLLLRHQKEGHNIVFFFFCSDTKKTKHTRKQQQKKPRQGRELTFKLPLCLSFLAPSSTFPLLHFYFKCFLLASSYSQTKKKKNTKKKKTIEKKKYEKKGRSLPLSSHFALSLLALASAFPLLHFRFKCFLLTSSSQVEEKKKKSQRKKKP
jgi:hypothetical protein